MNPEPATTAVDYFRRMGFVEQSRASAPDAIRSAAEMASNCPGSATLSSPATFRRRSETPRAFVLESTNALGSAVDAEVGS